MNPRLIQQILDDGSYFTGELYTNRVKPDHMAHTSQHISHLQQMKQRIQKLLTLCH